MIVFDKGNIQVSVRNLVEFILREGDIDNRFTGKKDVQTLINGAKLHRKIQKNMGDDYESEVSLKITMSYEDFDIAVEGRADGVIIPYRKEENMPDVIIDEIKTTYSKIEKIEKPYKVHSAQAMCYGYIYAIQHDCDVIGIRITYANLDTENIKYFEESYTIEELQKWFNSLIDKYYKWAKFVYDHRILRNESAKKTEFPFEYRKGQRDIAVSVYKMIRERKNLYIQAPTGVGKTMSVFFPAIKAMGEELCDKIFYLTAKTIANTVAVQACNILREKNLKIKSIVITAKEKICPYEEAKCNPAECEYAKGHFDRINEAVFDMINHEDSFERDVIIKYAKKHKVCPFEMSLDASYFADFIICDYNYAFDPNAKLKRYFQENRKEDYVFLADEAHNLVDRARQMYSAKLCKEDFLEAKRIVGHNDNVLKNALEKCNKNMLEKKRECADYMYKVNDNVEDFVICVSRAYARMEKFMDEYKEFEGREILLQLYFDINNFLYICEKKDEKYRIISRIEEDGKFYIELMCINPSTNLSECMSLVNSTIMFSGTFLPITYYKELLTGRQKDYAIYINSPFDRENRLVAIGNDISSKYTRRNMQEYEKISEYIRKAVSCRQGNYMVFFSSYKFLENVKEVFVRNNTDIDVIIQENGMSEAKKEEFLQEFKENPKKTLVAFCIMGGIFSEGIDLVRDKLIGVIVVGTGFPQVGTEREIIREYFDEKGMNGFDYAYRYPGMNKVLQAAGRVIRTSEDKGIIMLLDERFLNHEYELLFPREWNDKKNVNIKTAEKEIMDFWKRNCGLEDV